MTSSAIPSSRILKKRSAKAEHGTSVDTAFQRIRDLIVLGKLAPGSWIVEGDLCEHLNMSRTPVRGALYLLQREGYILESRNGSKTRMTVAPLTKEDANELYLLIGRIEGWLDAAPRRCPKQSAKNWRQAGGDQRKASADRRGSRFNGPAIFDLDHEFHRLLVTAGSGSRLATLHAPSSRRPSAIAFICQFHHP